ncbi:ATPase, T2SS/T4P/T4SS family (plasmid) [Kitasatospora sp. NBC_00374]|uniref:CpaF family protein n=1 Tax=Kitasatospora sp. NBC_00374 TaxID=2975964 RepID=UPI002F9185CA
MAVQHEIVALLHGRVGEQLTQAQRDDARQGRAQLAPEVEREFARSLINNVLQSYNEEQAALGIPAMSPEEERELAEAVHARIYGAGALQPLLDDDRIENIDIQGDQTFVTYAGGIREQLPAVAASDDALIALVQGLATTSGLSSRSWDRANPQLDLTLPDGSRLSAVMEVSKRPALSIRRARLGKVFLEDLVKFGSLTEEAASMLRAAVLARKNIMIGGATDAGKTTMLRALANVIPKEERLITVERALELGLDEFPELHPNILVLEERLPNSEGLGTVTMAELVQRSLRQNPDRVIVGEVLGPEVVTMLNAMSQGNDGSLSTIHARSSEAVFRRLATYARQAAEQFDTETTAMLIEDALDFVIFLGKVKNPVTGVKERRLVSVREVNGRDGHVLSSEVFKIDSFGELRPAAVITCLDELAEFGYYPSGDFQ